MVKHHIFDNGVLLAIDAGEDVEGNAADTVDLWDSRGPIVRWTSDEIREDPDTWISVINAMLYAIQEGGEALRRSINDPSSLNKMFNPDSIVAPTILNAIGKVCNNNKTQQIMYLFDKDYGKIKITIVGDYFELLHHPANSDIVRRFVSDGNNGVPLDTVEEVTNYLIKLSPLDWTNSSYERY